MPIVRFAPCDNDPPCKPHRNSGLVALQLPMRCLLAIAVLFLCGCPRRQWTYRPPPAPAPSRDFDVHLDPGNTDPNGAPRNVNWEPQLEGRIPDPDACNDGQPYSDACTQNKPFLDQPDFSHEAFCFIGKATSGSPYHSFFGHADWMVAQYDGSVGWFNFGDDFDYNLLLVPGDLPQGAENEHGVTTNNNRVAGEQTRRYIELEWDSGETDDAFGGPDTPGAARSWWAQFKAAGHDNDTKRLAQLLHPSDEHTLACGTTLGLFGLDCDHGCRSEVHPVYALAIQRTEDPSDNEWSVLARNWGTGGYCSQYNDELAETSLSLVLPYSSSQPPTKVEVQNFVTTSDSGSGVECPRIYFQAGQPEGKTILNLTLPPTERRGVAAFSLKIQWPAGAQPAACTKVSAAEMPMALAAEAAHPAGRLRGEDYMGALLRGANQGRRPSMDKDILPALQKSRVRMQAAKPRAVGTSNCNGVIQVIAGSPPPVPAPALHRLRKDPAKRKRDHNLRTYICRQYRAQRLALPLGTQQDFNRACKGVK